MLELSRRKFFFGAAATLAVIRTPGLLMPVKAFSDEPHYHGIRFQTWPFGDPPSVAIGYAEGSQGTERSKLRPLSYWQSQLRRYELMGYPIYWKPI